MFVALRLITLPEESLFRINELVNALGRAVEGLSGLQNHWVAPVLPTPVIHTGHIICRLHFGSEDEAIHAPYSAHWRGHVAPLLEGTQINCVGYRPSRTNVALRGKGIWRALIFRTFPNSAAQHTRDLEQGLLLFPKYIPAIKSWNLSQISSSYGPKIFTHVWEQEFDSVDDFLGDYMNHPLHWGIVDSFFDAETPQYIVDPHVIQAVAAIDESIMR